MWYGDCRFLVLCVGVVELWFLFWFGMWIDYFVLGLVFVYFCVLCSLVIVVCSVLGVVIDVGIGLLIVSVSWFIMLCLMGCGICVLVCCEKQLFYSLCSVIGIIGVGVWFRILVML